MDSQKSQNCINKYCEQVIEADENFLPYYNFVCNQIKNSEPQLEKTDFFFARDEQKYMFAIKCEKSDYLISTLKTQICNYFLEVKKKEYMQTNLKGIFVFNNLEAVLIKILTMFDKEQDVLEIEKNLRLDGILYLNEFYYFKLKNLTKKWQQICDMTNENSLFFSSNNFLFELFRFLLSSIKPKKDMLFIECVGKDICLLDNNKEKLYCENKANIKVENFIIKILENYPSRLYYSISKQTEFQCEDEFFSTISLIFKKNLKILH